MWKLVALTLLSVITFCSAEENVEALEERKGKLLPIFQVVRFPNDVCTGTTRNGTCFTAEECSNLGGVNEGSCASGFGVCCVIKLSCGQTTSQNNSYIVQSSVTTLTSPCTYKVCPCSSDICRIRYDFTAHTLATQSVFTAAQDPDDTVLTQNYAIGDCTTDQFSIGAPGQLGSPIICGTNTGQHMIIDSHGTDCQTVNFNIGSSTTTTRSWDIYVTQYTCSQEDNAGPPGCLQYFTGTTGLVKSFGYLTSNTAAATGTTTTHLQNQNYHICVRREKGYCYICWDSWHTGNSFGLSESPTAAIAKGSTGTRCTDDYVTIPQGTTSTIAATTTPAEFVNRFCGRFLSHTDDAATPGASVCSRSYPFVLGFTTDDNEGALSSAADMGDMTEAGLTPGGIIGFALGFAQASC